MFILLKGLIYFCVCVVESAFVQEHMHVQGNGHECIPVCGSQMPVLESFPWSWLPFFKTGSLTDLGLAN